MFPILSAKSHFSVNCKTISHYSERILPKYSYCTLVITLVIVFVFKPLSSNKILQSDENININIFNFCALKIKIALLCVL